jgi:hypothetical protein
LPVLTACGEKNCIRRKKPWRLGAFFARRLQQTSRSSFPALPKAAIVQEAFI